MECSLFVGLGFFLGICFVLVLGRWNDRSGSMLNERPWERNDG